MKRNKWITMGVSLLAAFCLWLYVVTIVNPESETTITNIPVVLSGTEILREDHNLVVSGDYTEFVTVHFSGKTADMKRLQQSRDEITAVVDISKLRSTKEYTLSYEIDFPDSVQASDITIKERTPSTITLNIEKQATKEVPVVGDFSAVELSDGYMLESTGFDYDSVMVSGPESVVSQISSAVVTMERTNVDTTISEAVPYVLLDEDGNEVDTANLVTDVDQIEVSVNVAMYKSIPLDVTIIDGGGATSADVTYQIEPQEVTLSGDATVFEGLNKITLGEIDLSAIASNSNVIKFPILLPNEARNISGEEEATVTLTIKNKDIKTVKATNISFIGVPDGFEAESKAVQLPVTIRANTADIEAITADNIRVVADMSEFTQSGTYTVPVEIYIDGYDGAGAIGEYTVAVSLTGEE